MLDNILNSNIVTYVLIGVTFVLIILIIILSIALCRIKRKNKKAKEEKKAKRARKVKTREIIKQNSINNSQYSLVDYCEKDQGLNEENNKNNVNKSFNSSIYKKPNLSSTDSSIRHQMNITELDIPANALTVDSLNLSLINNKDYSLLGTTSDINSEINKSNIENRSNEPDRTKNTTSSVITTSIPGNNTLGCDNVRDIPPVHDSDILKENSYQSSRNHASISQQLLKQHPYIAYLKSLDSQNLLEKNQQDIEINSRNSQVGSSFENLNAINQKNDDDDNDNNDITNNYLHVTIPKSPNNLYYKTPLSPIMSSSDEEDSIPVHNVNGRNSTSYAENVTNVNKSSITFDETLNQNNHASKTPGRAVSFDDYLLHHNRSVNSVVSSSANRSHILRSASHNSANTVNLNISRNLYSCKNHLSSVLSLNEEEASSVLTEGTSVISIENIVPNVRRSFRMSHLQERAPEIQKVEISLSIDEIPEDVDINDEVEDVFMRPSMMRFVEVEPSPVLQLEAQTTRISFISNQSSPIILDSSSNDGKSSLYEENEEQKTSNNKINPSPQAVIIKINDNNKDGVNNSNLELDIVEKGQTLNDESIILTDNLEIENKK